ncbi:MAG: hypothetical protein ACE5JD_16745 [Candidatus Methylomirabilia bacterium]
MGRREVADREFVPMGRPWLLVVASLFLALLSVGTGVAWRRGVEREKQLRAELRQVYREAETLRSYVVQWQDRAEFLERQLSALSRERESLRKQLGSLEPAPRASRARPRGRRRSAPRR